MASFNSFCKVCWKLITLALITVASHLKADKKGIVLTKVKDVLPRLDISAGQRTNHDNCAFNVDMFLVPVPCQWKNMPSGSVKSETSVRGSLIYNVEWDSKWLYRLPQTRLHPFPFYYSGSLLLILKVEFKPVEQASLSPIIKNNKDSESKLLEGMIPVPNNSKIFTEITSYPQEESSDKSFKIKPHLPFRITFKKFSSPVLHLKQESCFKFRMRGVADLSKSDSLLLWADNVGQKSSRLIWSVYGLTNPYWRVYTVGINAGNYTFFFNGSVYLTATKSQWMMLYEIDDIEITPGACRTSAKDNTEGSYDLGTSPYSNRKCGWIPITKSGDQAFRVRAVALPLNKRHLFKTEITHESNSGINVCVTKQSNGSSWACWNTTSVRVLWILPPSAGKTETSEVREMPTPPDEGQRKKGVIFERKPWDDKMFKYDECSSHEFQCASFRCIPLYHQCDGRWDCSGGEDELNCPKHRLAFTLISSLVIGLTLSGVILVLYHRYLMKRRFSENIAFNNLPAIYYNSAVERNTPCDKVDNVLINF